MYVMSLLKNPDGEKSRDIHNASIHIASLKPIMRKLESKTHIEKRIQCDIYNKLYSRGHSS